MKVFAIFALLIGVSVLRVPSAHADTYSSVVCNDDPFQQFHAPPSPVCTVGDKYDAGDVTINRRCTFVLTKTDGTVIPDAECTARWIETYLHFVGPGCTDGGFAQQLNTILFNYCPF